jgi:hypothetical protein
MNEFYAYIIENILRYYKDPFSTDLYNEALYGTVGLITIISALIFNILYYYLINRPSFARWYHWLLIGLIHLSVCFLVSYFIPKDKLDVLLPDVYNYTDYLGFSLINSVSASLCYVFFMLLIRWWSTNAKQTPIPH